MKRKTVKARDCSIIAMCDGRNETKHPTVIHEGFVKDFVGIGWVMVRAATKADRKRYPVVKG